MFIRPTLGAMDNTCEQIISHKEDMLMTSEDLPVVLRLLAGIALGFPLFEEDAAKTKPIGASLEHVTFVSACASVRANLRLYFSENSALLILSPLYMVSPATCWCSCW